MDIKRERKRHQLTLSQAGYLGKVIKRYGINGSKTSSSPMDAGTQLSTKDCSMSEEEKAEMEKIPYANVVGSLMYAMVCTRPDLAYSLSIFSRYMANLVWKHCQALKIVLRYIKGTLDRSS